MYRSVSLMSFYVPCSRQSILFPCVARGFCDIGKSRKKRLTCDASKLSDTSVPQEKKISKDINKKRSLKSSLDLARSTVLDDTPLSIKKKSKKAITEKVTDKTAKGKEDIKLNSVEKTGSETTKLSVTERFTDSSIISGMKPFSSLKKKKDSQGSDINIDDSIKINTLNKDTGHTIQTTGATLSEIIPKLRSPSFRLEQNLVVPSEWAAMAESWSPSVEFLKSILNFPIAGIDKPTDTPPKSADYVSCFVTGDKNAAKVVPAVTTVLSKTMTSSQALALKLWRERLTKQLGEEGFQQHRTQTLTRGKQFHDTIQRYLQGESAPSLKIEELPLITGCWKSLVPVLNRIDGVIAVESEVLHPRLLYRGVIDCIVEIKGQPFIVEWKHSSRKRGSLNQNYDSPVQLMAYTGAINYNASYPFGVKNSLLVVAYDDGSPADVFLLSAPENGEHHWHTWLKRLHTYWTLQKAEKEL